MIFQWNAFSFEYKLKLLFVRMGHFENICAEVKIGFIRGNSDVLLYMEVLF